MNPKESGYSNAEEEKVKAYYAAWGKWLTAKGQELKAKAFIYPFTKLPTYKLTHWFSYQILLRCKLHCPLYSSRKFDCDEIVMWIKVVFPGFINDSDQVELFRGRVRNGLIDFSDLQRGRKVFIPDANHVMHSAFVGGHALTLR